MGEIWLSGIEERYIEEQSKWLRKLNSCIDRECLKIKYNERITVLKSHQEKNLEKNVKQLMQALEIEKAQGVQWQDRYKNALIDKNGKEHLSVDDAISSNDEAVKIKALTTQDGVTYASADSLREIVKYEALTDQHGVTFKSINSAITSNDGEINRQALTAKDGTVFESIDAAIEIQTSKLRAEISSNQSDIKTESELKENILIEPDVCDPHFEANIKRDDFGNFKYHYYLIGFNMGYTLTNNMQVPIKFTYMKDKYSKELALFYRERMLGPSAVMQPGDFVSVGTFRPFAIERKSIEELSETDLDELKVEYGCTVENFRNQTIKINKRNIKIEFPPETGIKDWRPFMEITPQSTKFEGLKFMLEG